jgi:hypothetical protein
METIAVSDHEKLTLSDSEIAVLARLASLDLTGFLTQATHNWKHIENIAATSVARTMVLRERGVVPESRDEIKQLLVLSFRCSMMAKLTEHIRDTPDLHATLLHDDAMIDDILRKVETKTNEMTAETRP